MIDDSKFWKTSTGLSNCILFIYLFIEYFTYFRLHLKAA